MEAKFWLDKWQANQIAFHEDKTHPMLSAHWNALEVDSSARVFVPLCGKSKDMIWLRERGHEIVGVELSEVAAQAFFHENELSAERSEHPKFVCYSGGGYRILCGDLFDLTTQELGSFGAIYDRAALIALPPETRICYAKQLRELCKIDTELLLVTLKYPTDALKPPPFIVADEEVSQYYGQWCDLKKLATSPAKVKGVDGTESAFQIKVNV